MTRDEDTDTQTLCVSPLGYYNKVSQTRGLTNNKNFSLTILEAEIRVPSKVPG